MRQKVLRDPFLIAFLLVAITVNFWMVYEYHELQVSNEVLTKERDFWRSATGLLVQHAPKKTMNL